MLTEEQMKLVNEKASIFETCVRFANNFLLLPDIDITFDDCPSRRFGTMDNAAESVLGSDGRGHVFINAVWFANRVEAHQDDVEFFLFHELRHIHQQYQIQLLRMGKKTREPREVVQTWKDGFEHYVRNEGGTSQLTNIFQEVEVDANAYGIILEMLYRNGRNPLLSIPEEANDLAEKRLQRYIDTLPEFKAYSKKQSTEASNQKNKARKTIVKSRKIGRNEPCPCGSGKKYKQCCGK